MDRSKIERHYVSEWGPPDFAEDFFKGSAHFTVFRWKLSSRTKGVNIYSTYGVSAYKRPGGEEVELLVGLSPACDQIGPSLANLAATIVQLKIDAIHGRTWQMGPLWEGTGLGFFLTLHEHSTIEPFTDGGERVEFFSAIPLFAYEAEMKKDEGLDALKKFWRDNRVRFWDPTRLPLVGSPSGGA
jgi:hypothetical protein